MVALRSGANLDRERVRVRLPNGLTRYLLGECNAREDNATAVQAQKSKDQPAAGLCSIDGIGGHAKPDQYGRGRYDLGRGSAHASCRQIFLRRG
jgi:hypothetical protein